MTHSPSLLRPNMKTSPNTAATGRATVGNSGTLVMLTESVIFISTVPHGHLVVASL
jgi:hypothetical protein